MNRIFVRETVHLTRDVLSKIFQRRSWGIEILESIASIGLKSLPTIVLCTAVSGMIMTEEIAYHLNLALSTIHIIPGFIGQVILRELGVSIPALLMVAKVGATTTAEIGSMKVTDQIDALVLLGISPSEYLVFPRFIAGLISGACLTVIATGASILFSLEFAVAHYQFSRLEFLNQLSHFLSWKDLFCAVMKGTLYGGIIPIISCSYGFQCEGGAEGVGSATTQSVVTSTLLIIILDFAMTYLFTFFL